MIKLVLVMVNRPLRRCWSFMWLWPQAAATRADRLEQSLTQRVVHLAKPSALAQPMRLCLAVEVSACFSCGANGGLKKSEGRDFDGWRHLVCSGTCYNHPCESRGRAVWLRNSNVQILSLDDLSECSMGVSKIGMRVGYECAAWVSWLLDLIDLRSWGLGIRRNTRGA